jgi:hypothetical protein
MSVEWAVEWALLSEVAGRPLSRQWPAIRAGGPAAADYVGPGIAVLYLDLESDVATLEWMTIDGDGFGDLWFPSREEAKEAAEEWGDSLGAWHDVPESEADVRAYVIAAARAALGV